MGQQAIDYGALAAAHGGIAAESMPPQAAPSRFQVPTREEMQTPWAVHALSPDAEKAVNTPLLSTGVDAVDGLTTPVNVAVSALLGGKPLTQFAIRKLAQFVGSAGPELAPEIVGMLSPRAGHALKILQKVAGAADAKATAGLSDVEFAKKQGLPQSAIDAIERAQQPVTKPGPRPVAPAAPPAEVPAPAPVEAAPAGNGLPDQKALNEAALAKRRADYRARQAGAATDAPADAPADAEPAKAKLTGPETKKFMELMKGGMKAADAFKAIAAERISARFQLPTDQEVAAAVTHRNTTGKW